jgi:hypothetical protein
MTPSPRISKKLCWSVAALPFALLCACHSATVGSTTAADAAFITTVTIKLDAAPDVGPDVAAKDAPQAGDVSTAVADTQPDRKPDSADAGICKHELNNPACWSTFDITRWTDYNQSFVGAIFDGTYVNFFNDGYGSSAESFRYDTTKPFLDDGSWSGFLTSSRASDISGGAFDGRYIYLISSSAGYNGTAGGTYDDVTGRYDAQASKLSASTAWSSLDLTKASSGTADLTIPGYIGGAFDGRYLYFAPFAVGDTASGKAMRYDTLAPFALASSWTWFDMTTVHANAKGFEGAVFDGRYLYFIPNSSAVNPFTGDYTKSGVVMRYDTKADFADVAAWSPFDTGTLTPAAQGFSGATFDGRYIYLVPDGDWIQGVVPVRYDTQGTFTDPTSWWSLDLSRTNVASDYSNMYFRGASFDGRYVYYIPGDGSLLLRYDNQGDFSSTSAWNTFDMWAVGGGDGYHGATFDGRYLYILPRDLDPILRFDAVSPGALPSGYGASFY